MIATTTPAVPSVCHPLPECACLDASTLTSIIAIAIAIKMAAMRLARKAITIRLIRIIAAAASAIGSACGSPFSVSW